MRQETEIAVIGAGVVGLCTALELARDGREVTLIAPREAGTGASAGNAGLIADYAVMPVGTPEVLMSLPRLLLGRDSPLAIRAAALPTLAPWLARFAHQSLPGAAARNACAIAALLRDAPAAWCTLAGEIGARDLMRRRGSLYLYDTARSRRGAEAGLTAQREFGVNVELVSADELGQLEPALPRMQHGAAFFPDTISLSDPRAMLGRLEAAVGNAGIERLDDLAVSLTRQGAGAEVTTKERTLAARRVVIAAGAWSRPLARAAGDRVPLDTERGYHLEFDMSEPLLSRPCTPVSRGFYLSPMDGRLRAAGTVELGGLHAPPSPQRLRYIEAGARALLPQLPAPDRSWMGFRPSVPDSVPVIGPSRRGDEILMAFGHGHLGLTLAPVTARMIAHLIANRPPPTDPAPYAPARF